MITMNEYLMGRVTFKELSPEFQKNALRILERANELLEKFGESRKVNSGYRSEADQARINPKAPRSKHLEAAAVDLEDKDHKLKDWCIENMQVLETIGLWMEATHYTPTWVHVQCIPPKSGHRIFIP